LIFDFDFASAWICEFRPELILLSPAAPASRSPAAPASRSPAAPASRSPAARQLQVKSAHKKTRYAFA
jgi:hypothetical protein